MDEHFRFEEIPAGSWIDPSGVVGKAELGKPQPHIVPLTPAAVTLIEEDRHGARRCTAYTRGVVIRNGARIPAYRFPSPVDQEKIRLALSGLHSVLRSRSEEG